MAACPALLIAAPASGQGKTSIVAGLARLYARQGNRVRVFKCGPDFLDPMIHAVASGAPCENIDLWMCGEEDAAWRLTRAAQDADVILVEGVMGLFDGTPSAADIARRFKLPVLAVIDASAMAQTFGALAHGLAHYQPDLPFYGVLANRVASTGHAEMLEESIPSTIRWCGTVPRDETASLPERHLGLHQAAEIKDLMARLDCMADHLAKTPLAELLSKISTPAAVSPEPSFPTMQPLLKNQTIAIARDAAFCFLYPANLELLERLGAQLKFFSPLAGEPLPKCDALWLPGGYPELHAAILSQRHEFFAQLTTHVTAGKPLLAECGGMMTLFDTLTDTQGATHPMAALLPGRVVMQPRLTALGGQEAVLPEGTLRGHTFHYSKTETSLEPLSHARRQRPLGGKTQGEAIYRRARLTASYVHFYFPSHPAAAAALFLP
ncbi:MAG: cobyrinate a,c-diamide synthase [Rugosibacter sp.]|jgi:cobyrinic acid a,c-diamide synthase|nr:cobyrinate a,c-diamide synthase [Rugosibacter sp.]